jgi:hypothetical protein
MQRLTATFSICLVSGFLLVACQGSGSVHAGNEEYKPRPAPPAELTKDYEAHGELLRVDRKDKEVIIHADSGTVETFKFNNCTEVNGLQDQPQTSTEKAVTSKVVRSLVGKEGSKIVVQWAEGKDARVALAIEVIEANSAKYTNTK